MSWSEGYAEKKQGIQGLTNSLMNTAMQEKADDSSALGGVLKLFGGAALMIFGGPLAPAGVGLAGSGVSDIF